MLGSLIVYYFVRRIGWMSHSSLHFPPTLPSGEPDSVTCPKSRGTDNHIKRQDVCTILQGPAFCDECLYCRYASDYKEKEKMHSRF